MGCKLNLTNERFGNLLVVSPAPNRNKRTYWNCICDCGEECVVATHELRSGDTRSCGCLHQKANSENGKKSKKYNTYDLRGEYGIGWTSNTNNEFYFDLEDYELIKDYCWCESVSSSGYHMLTATIRGTNKRVRFHHLLNCQKFDHINRNPLDNRKLNLRPCTVSQNGMNSKTPKNNTSGIIGVTFHKGKNKWRARINIDKQRQELGYFDNKDDAIKCRLAAEAKYYGKFAPQKHLFEQYGINTQQNDLDKEIK